MDYIHNFTSIFNDIVTNLHINRDMAAKVAAQIQLNQILGESLGYMAGEKGTDIKKLLQQIAEK